jgi:FKBP-type peptidyl-prolyl cis-trans isomerase
MSVSGVLVDLLKSNNGRPLEPGDSYELSYIVALSEDDLAANQLVDSSDWYEKPVVAGAGGDELLPGLTQALQDRSFGDTIRVRIPPELAFGSRGVPGRVPPNAALFVQVEITAHETLGP